MFKIFIRIGTTTYFQDFFTFFCNGFSGLELGSQKSPAVKGTYLCTAAGNSGIMGLV
jgi:hypothetical protein